MVSSPSSHRPPKRHRGAKADLKQNGWRIEIPTIEFTVDGELVDCKSKDGSAFLSIAEAYERHQAVYLPNYLKPGPPDSKVLHWKEVSEIFSRLNTRDQESFCVENGSTSVHSPDFLKDKENTNDEDSKVDSVGYCSFLVQNKESLDQVLEKLPVTIIHNGACGCSQGSTSKIARDASSSASCCCAWNYEPCLWIFFGRNTQACSAADLEGRPEHTDSISHDGTWHYQLSGTKRWVLRPTKQLMKTFRAEQDGGAVDEQKDNGDGEDEVQAPIVIDCRSGDVLIVNTRLWFHQTLLPPQPLPSVSYARDFWTRCARDAKSTSDHIRSDNGGDDQEGMMSNVDGLYATDDIEEGTIIFKETDNRDVELHRSSTNPNCVVVELEDGTQAVVAMRKIQTGEFFCIAESSDEEGGGEDDDEEEEFNSEFEEECDDDGE